jgi:hypothetical protein
MINFLSILSPVAVLGAPALLALRYGRESRPGFDERRTDRRQNL